MPPEVLASEDALSRSSVVSFALSQMLADPLWHRGQHPMQRPPTPDPLIRRVEYRQPRDPSPGIRRRDPSPGIRRSRPSSASGHSPPRRCAATAAPSRLQSSGCSRSSSKSSMEASDILSGYPVRDDRNGSSESRTVASRRGAHAAVSRPPRPRCSNGSCASKPPAVPRPPRRQQSSDPHAVDEESPTSRRGSLGATSSQDRPWVATRTLPRSSSAARSLSCGRPASAGTGKRSSKSCSRSTSAEHGVGSWPTPSRSRCREPPLGRYNDEDRAVPTIRAPQ